jgi:hypothetical protein
MNGIKSKTAIKAALAAAAMLAAPVALSAAAVSSASASAGQATLMPGQVLSGGQSLVDGPYTMAMQTDGNFVLYAGNQALWQSHTYPNPGSDVVMQTDGNLVVYSASGHALWQSGTYNQPGDYLAVQTDGNAVIYTPGGQARWATNTVQTPVTAQMQAAANWARSQLGSTWSSHYGHDWSGYCEQFAEQAEGFQFSFGSAYLDYQAEANAGRIHTDANPPVGALVFYGGGNGYGHVAVSIGNGQEIGTYGYSGQAYPIMQYAVTGVFSPYLGWADPFGS